MKKTLLSLSLTLVVLGLVAHIGASESPRLQAAQPVPAMATPTVSNLSTPAEEALVWPLQPAFLTANFGGGTCVTCNNHSDCVTACGNPWGSCLADFGLQCGSDRNQTYCFCF